MVNSNFYVMVRLASCSDAAGLELVKETTVHLIFKSKQDRNETLI